MFLLQSCQHSLFCKPCTGCWPTWPLETFPSSEYWFSLYLWSRNNVLNLDVWVDYFKHQLQFQIFYPIISCICFSSKRLKGIACGRGNYAYQNYKYPENNKEAISAVCQITMYLSSVSMCICMYFFLKFFSSISPICLFWGTITGVRPFEFTETRYHLY